MGIEPAIELNEGHDKLEGWVFLGAGGMAETWAARQARGDGYFHWFCLKFIRPEFRNEPMFRRLFRREAQIGSELRHKNIVSLIETDAEFGYLKFELIDGVNLRELLANVPNGRLASELVAFIAIEVCQALEYVHGAGVLHLDVKASNILVSTHGEVKLVDFGIAMRMPTDGGTATKVRGTPEYMAPEQAAQQSVDGRTDLYSLGVLLYEMLTGRRPVESDSEQQIFEQLVRREYPPLTDLVDVEPALAAIVETLMQPEPADRFPTAAVTLDRLCETPPKPTLSRELGKLARGAQVVVTRIRKATPITSFVQPMLAAARSRKESQTTAQPSAAAAALLRSEEPTTPANVATLKPIGEAPAKFPNDAGPADVAPAIASGQGRVRAATTTVEILRRSVHVPRRRVIGLLGLAALVPAGLIGASTALTRDERPSHRTPTSAVSAPAAASAHVISTAAPIAAAKASTLVAPRELPKAAAPAAPPDSSDAAERAATSKGSESSVIADAAPAVQKARLRIGAFPTSRIWVNGKCRGPAPFNEFVAPGTYLIGVGDERPTHTRYVQARAGKVAEWVFNLSDESSEN